MLAADSSLSAQWRFDEVYDIFNLQMLLLTSFCGKIKTIDANTDSSKAVMKLKSSATSKQGCCTSSNSMLARSISNDHLGQGAKIS